MLLGVPTVAQWVKNPTSVHEDVGSIPGHVMGNYLAIKGMNYKHPYEMISNLGSVKEAKEYIFMMFKNANN